MAQIKSSARNNKTDHLLAMALRAGAVIALVLVAAGAVLELFHARTAVPVLRAGVLVLMSTPVLRIALSVYAFWREGDQKYMLIALAVLAIVLLGAVLRVAA